MGQAADRVPRQGTRGPRSAQASECAAGARGRGPRPTRAEGRALPTITRRVSEVDAPSRHAPQATRARRAASAFATAMRTCNAVSGVTDIDVIPHSTRNAGTSSG